MALKKNVCLTDDTIKAGSRHAKTCLRTMRTAKVQISLHIRAGWSGPLLSDSGIIGYNRMYKWEQMHGYFARFAHVHFFTWRGPYDLRHRYILPWAWLSSQVGCVINRGIGYVEKLLALTLTHCLSLVPGFRVRVQNQCGHVLYRGRGNT